MPSPHPQKSAVTWRRYSLQSVILAHLFVFDTDKLGHIFVLLSDLPSSFLSSFFFYMCLAFIQLRREHKTKHKPVKLS